MGVASKAGMAMKNLSGVGVGGFVAGAIDIGFTVSSYTGARKEGRSVPSSFASAASTALVNSLLPFPAQLAYMGLTVGYDVVLATSKANTEKTKKLKNVGSGYVGSGHFDMSGAGYTMRQRNIEKMRSSGMNINSVLGNEARNYISSSRKNW